MTPIATGVAPDLSKIKPYAAMLFDVYGTLLISRAGEIGFDPAISQPRAEIQDLLRRYDIRATPERISAELQQAVGISHAKSREMGISHPDVDIARIWQTVLGSTDTAMAKAFALEYELIVNPVYPMPAMAALLRRCHAANMPVGIVSNAQFYTVCLLTHFLGAPLEAWGFQQPLLLFSWKTGHAKPSTLMFERAKTVLSSMGIQAPSTLYVGNDKRNDILPAASVGFCTALFAGDQRSFRPREDDDYCRDLQPDLIVTDLRQLNAGVGGLHARG